MWSILHGCSLLLILLGCTCAQVVWVTEPPARLVFSNSTGARVTCAARASPPPAITWLTDDGAPLASVPGLREVFNNGTLVLGPFSASEFRADVHAAVYRCRAANSRGAVLSRDTRPVPVMDVWWEARVVAAGGAGGAALLTCSVPTSVRDHTSVTRWFRDATALPLRAPDDGGMHVIGGPRGEQLVVQGGREEGAYSCEVLHELTAERKRSEPLTLTVTSSSGSMAPRMLTASSEEWVSAGADIRLLCAAVASPPPTYSWFRQWGGRSSAVSSDLRLSVTPHLLVIRRVNAADAGRWSCRAHNQFGEQRRDVTLHVRVPLVVTLTPQLQIADSGSSVMFNCSVSGGAARVRWLHDGAPVGGGERELRLHHVVRAHRGMYQCLAERDMDLAQASAELRLGDTAPELHYTFIEQALHPGPALALHCAASGSPAPRFTWLLDSIPIEELSTPHRSITQFVNVAGEVVSYLNISSVRAEDGGRYTCRAANSRGAAEHSARLNVYGPPSLRSIGPVRAVAGLNTTVHCPYSGFPISDIRWQRGSVEVPSGSTTVGGGRAISARGGQLLLWPAEPADAGLYSCRVTAPSGQYAQKDIQIFVRNPPKISGFSFPTDLVEGSSVQALCGITSGDKPVYFSWLKDGQHIPNDLQIQEKSLEDFSFLIFSRVSARHSGQYTCVATNNAAAVNHTATLYVKVAPSWVYEPQNVSVLLGAPIIVHCTTKGYPEPRITWAKEHGLGSEEFRPVTNMEFQTTLLSNGSLSILSAARHHEGVYMCRADNGIGRGLTKTITIAVNEPAAVEAAERNVSVARGAAAALSCSARGDAPLALRWTRGDADLQPDQYRVSISEKRSEGSVRSVLRISRAERHDSGVYRCRAENPFGRDELLIYLAVQELPMSPRGVVAARVWSRAAALAWRRADDGGAPVLHYRLQLRAVTAPPLPGDWSAAPARDLPAHTLRHRNEPGSEDGELLEYMLDGLRPATIYALRLAAINAIGDSEYSETIIIQTLEEAPSEPPHNVQIQATAPGELFVQWQTPPQESWNGELLGYAITWREVGEVIIGYEHSIYNNISAILTVLGWGAVRATVVGLKPHAHYEVKIRAFNTVGGGPASTPITVTTLNGAPEVPPQNVRCEALSSQAIRIRWEPPPINSRGGNLLGYEILYEVIDEEGGGGGWWQRASGSTAELSSLRAATTYSVLVRARAAAGPGPAAPPATCTTHDDLPGALVDVKAVPNSEDSIIVSWLTPTHTNGKITHYTVYYRPQSTGVQSSVRVPAVSEVREQWAEIRGLHAHLTYEVWVTASGNRGPGNVGARVTATPNFRAPAKIVSFPRLLYATAGTRLRVPCVGAGSPAPRAEWSRGGSPLYRTATIYPDGAYLVIQSVDSSSADNYTCVVRNAWGEQRGVWAVRARRPPPAPRANPSSPGSPSSPGTITVTAALSLQWEPPALAPSDEPIHGYIVEYQQIDGKSWQSIRVSSEARSLTLSRLTCGTTYKLAVRAYNSNGVSTRDELITSTAGGAPKPPLEKNMISSNKTCVRLNLLTWDSNECPITQFIISIRSIYSFSWRSQPAALDQPYEECDLSTATWHQLKVHATNSAGTTTGNYHFAILSDSGEKIPPPASFPDDESTGLLGPAIVAVTLALLALTVILGVILYRKCPMASCKGYEQGDAMSDTEDKSSVEKRDNRRNCQQVYTSSPIKPHLKKEHQELYEISPYATFSMATGATGAGVGAGAGAGAGGTGSGTLRTFGRAEPLPLTAAPPRRSDLDEYCVTRGMSLSSRRAASDSDSSNDEPCRAHRTDVECVRGVTDSSAESASGDRRERRRRRRHPAAHNTPRYQQRHEQERRDFTIHV